MPHDIKAQPGIDKIVLYKGGESHLPGRDDVLKLSSNENPFGPSKATQAALVETAANLHRYPPSDHAALRAAIAEVHGLDADRIICGAGSDEIITFLCQAYAGPGRDVLYTEHGFSMYKVTARAFGAEPVVVPERERRVDVEAILEAAGGTTGIVFVTNPGNPTATMLDTSELERLADALPSHVLLVLDGAYAEFAEGFDGGASIVDARDNVVMLRTFSKLYALGGLRIGWGYGPAHVIDMLNRVKGPFNLSNTQLETARAAVLDRGFADWYRAENARLRDWLRAELETLGIPSDPSHANFVLARFVTQDEAEACEAHLRGDGILVRKVAGYNLPECLRITVGDEAGCKRVIASIKGFREGQA